ncbi:XRE family transcriptional regulator [Streptomyces sp. YC504]|uniref:XRE family transcriptional regulator n=2 Tax=Streptomyces mesophilus TaxID=1775132 RepID=A0A6G4XMA8_9ACTN|nr:XRE family transcriptional regulator [Streptomyces mesophilus]
MRELDMTQAELAELMNDAIGQLTGTRGKVSARSVFNLVSGKTGWPHTKQRIAIEMVFGCTATELGFTPRTRNDQEDPVLRRTFHAAAVGLIVGAATTGPAQGAPRRVGAGDIQRLHAKFAEIIAKDHRQGGRLTIETQALGLAGQALELLQRDSCSQRIQSAVYATAASFTSSAMWAAIDGRRFDAAQRHFDRASTLAGMSDDHAIQFRIWSHAGSLYRHLGRPVDALAANDAARRLPITRRDPIYAALGHARHAAIYGIQGDTFAIRRTLGLAQDAFDRADPAEPRPLWLTAFFDRAELHSLATAAHLSARDYATAEAHAHRSLAALRPELERTRAITTARLAQAQLGQGDLGPAVDTAMSIPVASIAHPRVAGMLTGFSQALQRTAPTSTPARQWDGFAHAHLRRTHG